ncbi:hypothetical protein AMAG_16959 [Allomyces macrogynus ATCC 38327]|uniref:Uncharacterized protein n=1 Tax=Allomyces macrogynus (strain ATCC 38327) TaxID=578462 RepID=A0A0L0TE39_ALLM3|nr:hypothetical protein AMAG_16959 [Allomyces macrogynus ATCC 38327]|eukprot:KNE72854.1 hypothetical protein AMAG_16959 [Allomyces macrogynus ATCC 38327]
MADFWAMLAVGVLATVVALLAQAPAPVDAGSFKLQALPCTSSSTCNPSYGEFCDKSRGAGVCALSTCSIQSSKYACSRYNETTYCDGSGMCVAQLAEGATCPSNLQMNDNQPCQVGLICDPYTNKCMSGLSFFEAHKGLVIGLGIGGILLVLAITWCLCCCCGCCGGCCGGCCRNARYRRGKCNECDSVPPAAPAVPAPMAPSASSVAYPQPPPPPYPQPAQNAYPQPAPMQSGPAYPPVSNGPVYPPMQDVAGSSSNPYAGAASASLYPPVDGKKN